MSIINATNEAESPALNKGAVSVLLESCIAEIKELGYSVLIRERNGYNVIMWSTKKHWASATYKESSEDDIKRVSQRLKDTIYSASLSNECLCDLGMLGYQFKTHKS